MQVRFFSKEGWQGNSFHFHDQLEILLMMSTGGSFHVYNETYPITRGGLFVLSTEDLHRSVPSSKSFHQFYSIRFCAEEVSGFSSESCDLLGCFKNRENFNHFVQLQGDQLDHLLKLINKMEYYLSEDCSAFGKSVMTKLMLAETLVYVNYLYRDASGKKTDCTLSIADDITQLQPLFSYIQEHLDEDLSLDTLSAQIYMNKYYLSHRFKEIMGYTLNEYIVRRRLSNAKNLLRQNYSISFAGESSGFHSVSHFIRTFTKYTGVSPKQYQKQYQNLETYISPSPVHRDVFSAPFSDKENSTIVYP